MEKKQNRSVQAPTKGTGTESKKNQDVATGKFWPRGGRRREPVGGSIPSKNDSGNNRKPLPQRNKSLDKRPRPRGGGYNSGPSLSGKENTGLALGETGSGTDAELGSVFVPGSKKQSLNHLLNFHYTPRGDYWGSNGSNGSRVASGSQHHRWFATQKHKYNKEQFLQANCQFVVNSEGNYKLYMNNPDALVDWDLVEQIHVQVSEFPSCPICLYPPVAAKMTRCGHVYCWSCILHYLALSDKTWRKCPICYESVQKTDLKSVIAIPHAAFNVGEYITFRLMKRAQGSLTAVPVDEAKINRNALLFMSEPHVNTVYSKLLLANPSEVLSIIDRERTELTAQLTDDDNPEKCFIEQAIAQLQEREKIVFGKISTHQFQKNMLSSDIDSQKSEIQNCESTDFQSSSFALNLEDSGSDLPENRNRTRFESVSSEGQLSEDLNASISPESIKSAVNVPINGDNTADNTKYYYFYQAADGQHIYLHAMNIRMLEHTYGALEQCPTTLNGRIVEKEGGSMTEELRRRLRYLQHLPVTCQFEIAEIQLRPPIITKESLDFFQEQLDTRKKRRQRRARDEKRREKRIVEEENRRMGKLPEVDVHIESLHQFPQFGADDPVLGAENGGASPVTLSPNCEWSPTSSQQGSVPQEERYSGPSFAKMLATGKSKPPSWPDLASPSAQREPSTPRLINVTRSQAQFHHQSLQFSPSRIRNRHSDSEPEPEPEMDGYVPAPAFNQSFSDAIALAFEKAAISEKDIDDASVSGGKKKKKKKSKKVLFATSMVYSGK